MGERSLNTAARDSTALVVASVINGVAAYAIVVMASRAYDEVDFAAFSVAWSIWALAVGVLIFPLQHWIIWRSTVDSGTGGVWRALPRVVTLVGVALVMLFFAGSSRRLFPHGSDWPWMLVAIGASSAFLGIARGILAAGGRYRAVAWVIGSENVVRFAVVSNVVRLGYGPEIAALSLAAGLVVVLPFIGHLQLDREATGRPLRVVAELGALAGATALAQALVQFPPAYAEWLGEGPATVSALFATFAIGRAPMLILLALTTRLTEPLTQFLADSKRDRLAWWRRSFLLLLGATLVAYLVGLSAGPPVVRWFFGEGRALSGPETALVAAGLTLAMSGVIAILALLGLGASRRASFYWSMGVIMAVALGSFGVGIPAAFAAAEASTILAAMVTIRGRLRQSVGPRTG